MPARTVLWLCHPRFHWRDFVPQLYADDCQLTNPPNSLLPTCVCWDHFLHLQAALPQTLARCHTVSDPSVWKFGLFHLERLHFLTASSGWGKVALVNKFKLHFRRGDELKFACYTCLWYFNELLDAKKKMQYEWMLDVSHLSLDFCLFFLLTSVHKDSFPSVFL